VDVKPSANPNAMPAHMVLEGVVFEGTATGQMTATNPGTSLLGRFLITRQ